MQVRPDAGQGGQTQPKALALHEAWKDEHGDKTYGMLTHIASKLYVISPPKAKKKEHQLSSKIDENLFENRRKNGPNRQKIALGRCWVSKTVSGTRRGAFGTRPGRTKAGPGSILGRPGHAKSG